MKRAAFALSLTLLCTRCGGGPGVSATSGSSSATTGGSTSGGTTGGTTTGGTTGGCAGCHAGETCVSGHCACDPSTCTGNLTCTKADRCVTNACRIGGNQNDGTTCAVNRDCGCPLFCGIPDGGSAGICQRRCNVTAECPQGDTSCKAGLCQRNDCGGESGNGVLGGPCDAVGQADGTCVPHARTMSNGLTAVYGTCVQNGCAAGACSLDAKRTEGYALCKPGFACLGQLPNPGICYHLCDLDGGTVCSSTQGCHVLSSNDPYLSGCVPLLPSDGGEGCVPPPQDAGNMGPDWHEPFSLVTLGQGGVVLHALELTTIDYAGYDQDHEIQDYAHWIVGSNWLSVVGQSYGVGLGNYVRHYTIPSAAPASLSESDIETQIESLLGVDGGLPVPKSSSLYFIYFPASTTISGSIGTSCVDYGGYHSEDLSGTYDVPYAVIPTCGIDLSVVVSHELIEAATDPFVGTLPGYRFYNPADAFYYASGGEVGDLCQGILGTFDGTRVAQRIWSNDLAHAGVTSPCAPVPPGEIYVNLTPTFSGIEPVHAGTTTLRLTGWSNNAAAAGSWSVLASTLSGTDTAPTLSASTVGDGQNITLTLNFPVTAMSGDQTVVRVDSTDPQGNTDWWPMIFQVQ